MIANNTLIVGLALFINVRSNINDYLLLQLFQISNLCFGVYSICVLVMNLVYIGDDKNTVETQVPYQGQIFI